MNFRLTGEHLSSFLSDCDTVDISNPGQHKHAVDLMAKLNHRVPYMCDPHELAKYGVIEIHTKNQTVIVGASSPSPQTDLPARLFYGRFDEQQQIGVYGVIEGPQAHGEPFVGYIETDGDQRRQRLASQTLPLLDRVTRAIYARPLTAGPEEYLSHDGSHLRDAVVKYIN